MCHIFSEHYIFSKIVTINFIDSHIFSEHYIFSKIVTINFIDTQETFQYHIDKVRFY
jgi:hypothetical protein